MATPNTQQPQQPVVPPPQQAVHAVPPGYTQQQPPPPVQPAAVAQPVYVPVQVPVQRTPEQIVKEEKEEHVEPLEVKLISHTTLFYWWPVWAVGFLMAFLTYVGGNRMAIVPDGTVAEQSRRYHYPATPYKARPVPPPPNHPTIHQGFSIHLWH